jgi:hypothetical protein
MGRTNQSALVGDEKQRWQPPVDGRWGRVVGREGTELSVGRSHDVWKGFTKFGEGLKRPTNYHSLPTNNELQGLHCSCPPNH